MSSTVEYVLANDDISNEIVKPLEPEQSSKLTEDINTEKKINLSTEIKSSAKSDIPIDSKWSLVPKPDGKDDIPFENGDIPEEYLPQPPIAPEDKDDEEKVEIGQSPRFLPFFPHLPMIVPKRASFRVLSLFPVPPRFRISDRLPLEDADVLEESSESAVVEDIAPGIPLSIKEGKKIIATRFIKPIKEQFEPVAKVFKDSVQNFDGDKVRSFVKSEILNIAGKKLLMQAKVLRSEDDESGRKQVSIMSIRPIEDVDPEVLKEVEKEMQNEETIKQNKDVETKSVLKEDDAVLLTEKKDFSSEFPLVKKISPVPETLDAEKSEVDVKYDDMPEAMLPPPEIAIVGVLDVEKKDEEMEEKAAMDKEPELELKAESEIKNQKKNTLWMKLN
ncbi:uncharacterized protein CDAR_558841 [Caerostris darwini]|uniref:Uncharacterized protein n=1 Tax=Caerostris darwini TaxID=1538125 RepID=A0AAV4V1W7_9ARAC|nr:uncharacterized protein CDAR_558841 [Caerostris darwini]